MTEAYQKYMSEGEEAYYKGDLEKALECYQAALSLNPDHPEALKNVGWTFYAAADFVNGIAYTQRAIEVDPTCWRALSNLGCMYLALNEPEKALSYAERALVYSNSPEIVYCNLGNIYTSLEKFNQAEASYMLSIEKEPHAGAPRLGYANLLKKMGRLDDAILWLNQIIEDYEMREVKPDPHPWKVARDCHKNLGEIYGSLLREDSPLELCEKHSYHFQKVVELDAECHPSIRLPKSDLHWAYTNLGGGFYNLKEYEKAIEILEYAGSIAVEANTHDYYNLLGYCYEMAGQQDKAESAYKKAMEAE
ncbi:MAG TPA: tetratricopeptide repeat protein [Coleofasciculaceae cyanobacterium]|jgi:tetratricopeptide (TPR) repeat protein